MARVAPPRPIRTTTSLVRFAQTRFVFTTWPKYEARKNRIRTIIRISPRLQIICLLSSSRRLPVFFFTFFFSWYFKVYLLNSIQTRGCSVRYAPSHTAGITGTWHFGKIGTTSIPVPDTSVSSVRFGKIGMTSIRYRTLRPVRSVRHQYRYRTLRQVRHDINTRTGHFDKFGTTSIPVSRIPVPYRKHPCNMVYLFWISKYPAQLERMSFDEILDLTANDFSFYNIHVRAWLEERCCIPIRMDGGSVW